MSDYDTEQKPMRLNYVSIDSRTGTLTTVVDGRAVYTSNLQRLADRREPWVIDGKRYLIAGEIADERVAPDGLTVTDIEVANPSERQGD